MRWQVPGPARSLRGLVLICALAGAGGLMVGCGVGDAASADLSRVDVIKTPDGGIQPQAVVDARGTLHLIYSKGDPGAGDLFYVRRESGKTSFSAPVRVNSQPGTAVAAGTIRGGQLALGKNGRVHVVWFGSSQAKPRGPLNPAMPADSPYNGTPLLYTRLNEAGSAFEPQRNLMQFTYALDGGPSVAADAKGSVYAVWHAQSGSATGGEGARRLWVARSQDEGKSFTREAPAWTEQTGACACCGAKSFADSKGNVYALYRMARNKSERDMVLLASSDAGKSFQGERIDPWPVDTCPMSSEALVEGPNGVYAAWETQGQVKFARVEPGTVKHTTPAAAPGGGRDRKHPALAVNAAGETLLAWTEGAGWNRGGALAWQLYDRNGKPLGEKGRVEGGIPAWGLAAAVVRPDGGFTVIH